MAFGFPRSRGQGGPSFLFIAIFLLVAAIGVQKFNDYRSSSNKPSPIPVGSAVSEATANLPEGMKAIASTAKQTGDQAASGFRDAELPAGMKAIIDTDKPSMQLVQPAQSQSNVAPTSMQAGIQPVSSQTITIATPAGTGGSVLRSSPNGAALPPVAGKSAAITWSGTYAHLVPDGATVPLLGRSGSWANVQHEGAVGWVFVP